MAKKVKLTTKNIDRAKRIIGYARVSTKDQNLTLQRDALNKYFCDKIYEDKSTGANFNRKGLGSALAELEEGDTFIVWKLDRLGRSMVEVIETVRALQLRGVNFISCTENIDTKTPMGRFCFSVLAGLAELEREIIAERTSAGMQAAIRAGKRMGRKPKISQETKDRVYNHYSAGSTIRQVSDKFDMPHSTVHRIVREMRGGGF